jgi:Trk K+ transport system NAD-binding subunit
MALNADLRAIALTDSPKRNRPLEEVGVETAFSPHALIGRRLAHKAAASITVPEGTRVGDDVEVQELLVRRGSPLHGVEIRDTRLFEHPRLTIVAGWFDGELRLPPEPTDRLTPNSVLVVVGPADAIADVRERLSGVRSTREHSDVVVGAGHGGRAAVDALPDDVSVTTVAIEDREDVDVVVDVGDPETLVAAGIEEASALVVTIDDDATALLATALARSLADEIEVLVRVTAAEKVRIAFEAGADYALSVQRPTARLLARQLHGKDVISPVGGIRLVRADADPFEGESLAGVNRGTESGWVAVGVERDGAFLVDETTRIGPDDTVLVAGTDEMIQSFELETSGL